MNAKTWKADAASNDDALLSVAEAARVLRISQSTLWRWIDRGTVPAYRVGPKRVWLKRAELAPLLSPVGRSARKPLTPAQDEPAKERLLTPEEQARMFAAIEAAREFQAELLAARGGKLFSESWELLHESREERLAELS